MSKKDLSSQGPSQQKLRDFQACSAIAITLDHELFDAVYLELRRIAAWHLSRMSDAITLDPTDLTHEAVASVLAQRKKSWSDKTHLLAIGSMMIRRVLINHIRQRSALKRGGSTCIVWRDPDSLSKRTIRADEVLAIHEALMLLEDRSPRQARVVEMKYFGGLSTCDIAKILGCSQRSVQVEWAHARLWLHREFSNGRR
jgi:RNA polymerase sigma factor (TIGR02999 family)